MISAEVNDDFCGNKQLFLRRLTIISACFNCGMDL